MRLALVLLLVSCLLLSGCFLLTKSFEITEREGGADGDVDGDADGDGDGDADGDTDWDVDWEGDPDDCDATLSERASDDAPGAQPVGLAFQYIRDYEALDVVVAAASVLMHYGYREGRFFRGADTALPGGQDVVAVTSGPFDTDEPAGTYAPEDIVVFANPVVGDSGVVTVVDIRQDGSPWLEARDEPLFTPGDRLVGGIGGELFGPRELPDLAAVSSGGSSGTLHSWVRNDAEDLWNEATLSLDGVPLAVAPAPGGCERSGGRDGIAVVVSLESMVELRVYCWAELDQMISVRTDTLPCGPTRVAFGGCGAGCAVAAACPDGLYVIPPEPDSWLLLPDSRGTRWSDAAFTNPAGYELNAIVAASAEGEVRLYVACGEGQDYAAMSTITAGNGPGVIGIPLPGHGWEGTDPVAFVATSDKATGYFIE